MFAEWIFPSESVVPEKISSEKNTIQKRLSVSLHQNIVKVSCHNVSDVVEKKEGQPPSKPHYGELATGKRIGVLYPTGKLKLLPHY